MTAQTVEEKNKELVTAFYELSINQKKPTESPGKYIGLPYTQHNPEVPKNGPEGFIQFIEGMFKKHPDLKLSFIELWLTQNLSRYTSISREMRAIQGLRSQSFSAFQMERLLSIGM
jgi:predicted SnoaL-like aldol condensation-catalyzing enzyme